jgi:6-phosphogluconate dehydrogenase
VITASLIERFESRGLGEFGDKVLSALRSEFGGHAEKASGNSGRSLPADPTGT